MRIIKFFVINRIGINFRISHGYVEITPYITEKFHENLIESAQENKTAIVKCNEGFILDDPSKNKIFCNQETWIAFTNNSFNLETLAEGIERNMNLPECRKIVCKKHPVIVNGRLLKSVSHKN